MGHKQREALAWRRNKVQELLIQGLSQYEIADILKVSQPTINNDVQFLREKAKQSMQNHIHDVLPTEYQNCMAGINRILKKSWQIANNGDDNNCNVDSSSNGTISRVDDKTRLQALALANDCYKYKMELVTNGVVITDAIKFVQHKKEELEKINIDNPGSLSVKTSHSNTDKDVKNNTENKIF